MTNKKSRRVRKILLRGFVCFILLCPLVAITIEFSISPLVDYLDDSDEPSKADIIVVIGGGYEDRAPKAAQLYFEGYAPLILLSTTNRETDRLVRNFTRNYDVPKEVIYASYNATSTWDEANTILAFLKNLQIHSAIIVTSTFHMRRVRATYEHLNDTNIKFAFVSASSKQSDTKAKQLFELREYPKLLFYWLYYGVNPW